MLNLTKVYSQLSIGFFSLFFLLSINIVAQDTAIPPHIQMARSGNANFFDMQRSFNQYYQSRANGKSTGYKQFKRLEYWWEQRLYPTGELPEPGILWKETERFQARSSVNSRSNANWTERGPKVWQNNTGHWNPGLGRINVIAIHPNNDQIIYVGTPAGGVWKTQDGGNNWSPLTDDLPTLGVSGIAIDHSNPQIIYIGTGDRDGFDTYGVGVLKSTNGGTTWNTTGLNYALNGNRYAVNKLLMHPTNAQIIFAAATNGLYKTVDGGTNWTLVFNGDIDDLEFKPNDPNTLYAVQMISGGGSSVLKSTNGGNSFFSTGQTSASRAHIAVTAGANAYLYFFASEGLFRSIDSGNSFSRRGDCPTRTNQNWYDWAIAISHSNPEEVHVGAVETFVSTDGGQNFTKSAIWSYPNGVGYVHADIHEMVFYGNTLYVGSDGLISTSTDGGNTWNNISEGLGIRQFYNIAISNSNPNLFVGGAQDNGTTIHTAGNGWVGWLGADGFEAIIDPSDNNIIYGTSQNGRFYKTLDGGQTRVAITQPGDGAWSTPFVMDPTNNNTLFVGTDVVRKTTDGMNSWTSISSDFGETTKITDLTIAPTNNQYLYVAKRNKIWRTVDGGQNWSSIQNGLPNQWITHIAVHPTNPQKIAVTFSGYSAGEKIYISQDGGSSWTNISTNLPNIPANTIVFHNGSEGGIYIGMDVGVYYRDNNNTNWTAYNTSLPNVPITELEIQYLDNTLKAATYGRGMWESPLYNGSTGTTCGNTNLALSKTVTVSSEATSSFVGGNATDGDINTYWNSNNTDGEWLYVDLGESKDICKVVLKWGAAYGEDFTIIYWDGSAWQTVRPVTGNTNPTNVFDNLNTNAQYIGFQGSKAGTSNGYAVKEFEVYGVGTNNAPTISPAAFIIPENSPTGTAVGTATATDPDGDALNFTITAGNINNTFSIHTTTGAITVNDPTELDYETRTSIPITVTVNDPGGLSASALITVNISDLNDETLNCSQNLALNRPVTVSSEENTSYVGANATDGDMNTRWSSAFTDAEWMYVDLGQSYDLCKIIIRWEAAYGKDFQLIYWDGSVWQTITSVTNNTSLTNEFTNLNTNAQYIGVQGSQRATQYGYSIWEFEIYGGTTTNNAPTISAATFTIPENTPNGTYVGTVTASDPDGDALTYSIIAGNINNAFSIDNSGAIYVNNSAELDYETRTHFNLTVSVTDPGSLSASAPVTINLSDEQEGGCGTNNLALSRPVTVSSEESIRPGSNAVDGNINTRWASNFTDSEWLYVDLGQLTNICKVVIKWEAAYGKDFDIIYWDGSVWQVVQAVRGNTNLTNVFSNLNTHARYIGFQGHQRGTQWGYSIFEFEVYGGTTTNNAPSISDASFTIAENTSNGSYVGTVSASDPDGDALVYNIDGGNTNNAFSIDNGGNIYVNNSAALDYETRTNFSLTVSVTDPRTLSASATVTIYLTDQPECDNNLAQGQPVTVSSVENNDPALDGEKAVDGDMNTRWASNFTDAEWWYVDLGQSYNICKIVIQWERALGEDFDLIYWDGSIWQTIQAVTGNTSQYNEFNNLNTNAQFIGFLGHKRGTQWGYSIFEFEVYGTSSPSAKASSDRQPTSPSILNEGLVNLYPNPVRSMLNIEFESSRESESSINILDLRGQLIHSEIQNTFVGNNTWQISTERLAAGIYILQIKNQYGIISKRFAKVH